MHFSHFGPSHTNVENRDCRFPVGETSRKKPQFLIVETISREKQSGAHTYTHPTPLCLHDNDQGIAITGPSAATGPSAVTGPVAVTQPTGVGRHAPVLWPSGMTGSMVLPGQAALTQPMVAPGPAAVTQPTGVSKHSPLVWLTGMTGQTVLPGQAALTQPMLTPGPTAVTQPTVVPAPTTLTQHAVATQHTPVIWPAGMTGSLAVTGPTAVSSRNANSISASNVSCMVHVGALVMEGLGIIAMLLHGSNLLVVSASVLFDQVIAAEGT